MDLINQCLRTNIYDVVGDIKHNVSDLKVFSNTWEVKLGTQWICSSSSLSHYSLSIHLLHINEHLLQSSHIKFTQLWWSQPAAVSGSVTAELKKRCKPENDCTHTSSSPWWIFETLNLFSKLWWTRQLIQCLITWSNMTTTHVGRNISILMNK